MSTSKILIDGVGIDLTQDTVAANKMLSGTKAHDANGDVVTGNIPSKVAATYTPGTSAQTIGAGQYLGGAQTIQGDANLVAANIASGKTIFGVAGTHAGQKSEQSKTLTLGAAAPSTVTPDSGKVLSSVPVTIDTSIIKAENIAKDVTMLGITGMHEGGGGAPFYVFGEMVGGSNRQQMRFPGSENYNNYHISLVSDYVGGKEIFYSDFLVISISNFDGNIGSLYANAYAGYFTKDSSLFSRNGDVFTCDMSSIEGFVQFMNSGAKYLGVFW